MADTELLKLSRIKDDYGIRQRTSAAMFKQALYWADNPPADISVEGQNMMDWVLANPLQPIDLMTSFVAVMPEVVAAAQILDGGGVETAEVPDDKIIYQVGVKWNTVARRQFGTP